MKKILVLLATAALLCSCSSLYYQIATVGSNQGQLTQGNEMEFVEGDYVLTYNFWAESGRVSFVFTNTSDKDVYVDLSRSFLFVNGMTNDYYQNRTWTSTKGGSVTSTSSAAAAVSGNLYRYPGIVGTLGNAVSTSGSVISSASIETKEKEGVWVPAHSSRRFQEFKMMSTPYRKCSFNRFPSKPISIDFSEETSPYVYNNRLTISVDGEEKQLENTFFIQSLMNASENKVVVYSFPKDCKGNNVGAAVRTITVGGANKFYNKYLSDKYGNDMTSNTVVAKTVKEVEKAETITPEKNSEQPYNISIITLPTSSYRYTTIELESDLPMPAAKEVSILSAGKTLKCIQKNGSKKFVFSGEIATPFVFVIYGEHACSIKVGE